MAGGHGVDKPDKAEHGNRKVHRERYDQSPDHDPAAEDALSNDDWLKKMMKNYGHGGI